MPRYAVHLFRTRDLIGILPDAFTSHRPLLREDSTLPNQEDFAQPEPCDCEVPGMFCSGVPGILAAMKNGRLAPGAVVERCDLCQRYPSDEAAYQQLVELGLA
jgi:hypothetical protein